MITRTVSDYTIDATVKYFDEEGNVQEIVSEVHITNPRNPGEVAERAKKKLCKMYPGSAIIIGNVTAVNKKYSMEDEFFYANAKEEVIE